MTYNIAYNDTDSSAAHYVDYANLAVRNGRGGEAASFTGKAAAHVFDGCSNALLDDMTDLISEVDTLLENYVPNDSNEYCKESDQIRFWMQYERPAAVRTLRGILLSRIG